MFSSRHLSFSTRMVRGFVALGLLVLAAASGAQTFRGGISGRVVDESGAVLPGVTVTAVHTGTGATRTTTTSSTGAFSLPDLALGTYKVEATLAGFQGQRVTVEVVVSKISAVEFKMGVSGISETVEVTGTGAKLDTVSTALANVVGPQQVQDFPLNGRDFRRMLQLTPGVAQNNSVNGAGNRGNNYQIDGADNNDAFHNTSAVNQGGVSGIAGTLLPIEAIDQFAVQSGGQFRVGPERRLDRQPRDQVGHQRLPRQRLLLQPQRETGGELADRGAGHARSGRSGTTSSASRWEGRSSRTRPSSSRPSRARN